MFLRKIDVVKVEILRKKMSILLGQIFAKSFEKEREMR
jgi:hypothetical protein